MHISYKYVSGRNNGDLTSGLPISKKKYKTCELMENNAKPKLVAKHII